MYKHLLAVVALCFPLLLPARVEWGGCGEDIPARPEPACASLKVPLDPERADGEKIELFLVRYPARYQADQGVPYLLLAGGPGQGGSEVFPRMIDLFDPLRAHHALVIVDQRGTGRSTHPKCELERDAAYLPFDPDRVRRRIRHCLDTMDLDPRLFTTREAVMDLEAVRQALNVERIGLYGVSYGTRLATGYMRLHPQRLERVILDGVVPVDEPLGVRHAVNLQRVLDLIALACEQSAPCHAQWPRFRAHLAGLTERAAEVGGRLRLRHPRTGDWVELPLTPELPRAVLRMYSYQGDQLVLLPWLVEQAWAGDWQPLAAQALMLADQLDEGISMPMHNSVVCTEDWPHFSTVRVDNRQTVLGDSLTEALSVLCEQWPRGRTIADVRQPLSVDVPTLLLSGEWDPVTPPAFGERLAAQLPDSRHLVAPGQGHMLAHVRCVAGIIGDFADGVSLGELETSCLSRLKPPHLFLGANGPAATEGARHD